MLIAMLGLGSALMPLRGAKADVSGPPALGILMPLYPPDRSIIIGAMTSLKTETFGPFIYQTGTIDGVPVVVNVAPGKGPLLRSMGAADMLHRYNIKALLYPGTSGAHLGPKEMVVGDIVLGAANVDFGSFFMAKDGAVLPHEASEVTSGQKSFGTLYLDPRLLARLACAAYRTASAAALPAWLNPNVPRAKPEVFYYGTQGTSTMWLSNTDFIGKLHRAFGEIDEDGDWDSNMVAVLYKVPFIEVSGISDSILEYADTKTGVPATPAGAPKSASQITQDLSNLVLLDLIRHDGAEILRGGFITDGTTPFAGENFSSPKSAGALLRDGKCQ
jgi:adenosylhomocysteine nucleosidase